MNQTPYCTLCKTTQVIQLNNSIRNMDSSDYHMFACSKCGTHFIYPEIQEKQLQEYYDGKFRCEVHTKTYYDMDRLNQLFDYHSIEARERVERIGNQIKKIDDVLEIGCSTGYFLNAIKEKVKSVSGTEWDHQALEYIQDRFQGDIQTAQNPEEFNRKFDKIFMFHVLEHISDPVSYLENLKKILKPEGKIYIEVPNVGDIMIKTFHCNSFADFYYKKAHIFNFNEVGLAYIFDKSKFHSNIDYIQRYDISNHFHWLSNGTPFGKGAYKHILSEKVNEEYVKSLINSKQTDTLFAIISE